MTKVFPIIGWREWITLQDIRVRKIKAKIDTGAKTSALHAENIEIIKKGRKSIVYFDVFYSTTSERKRRVSAPLVHERWVKDTGGKETLRPVILTEIRLADHVWDIEVTLTNRSKMKHEFLLARDAVKGRFLINVAKSFVLTKIKKHKD